MRTLFGAADANFRVIGTFEYSPRPLLKLSEDIFPFLQEQNA